MTIATNGIATKARAGLLALALSGAVSASSGVLDPDAVAAGQELQIRLAVHLQTDADPRRQLVAAMLLTTPALPDSPAAGQAPAAARQAEAQAIFARVRAGTGDPWILWSAATYCTAPSSCALIAHLPP
jgi:hypothetical protein